VATGELLYRLETEKINLDVDAEASGTVRHLVGVGVTMKPGDVIGYIFAAGEEIPADLGATGAAEPSALETESRPPPTVAAPAPVGVGGRTLSSPAARRLAGELGVDYAVLSGTGPGGRIVEADVQAAAASPAIASAPTGPMPKASPLAKRIAAERGIDLRTVQGTGPGGRITQEDVETAPLPTPTPKPAPAPAATVTAGDTIAVRGMRKTIAQRMHSSLQNSAQLTMDMDVDMEYAVRLREQLIDEWRAEGIRPTYTDLIVRATAKALRAHPLMNSQMRETEIALLNEVHVGIAVALPEGLVVPVVRNADALSVKEIAVESSRLAASARDGTLGLDDFAGGTFTVTALGMYGVDSFTPIINEPQAGILGVNRIFDGLRWEGEVPVKRKSMRLSLTWDHRVLDGAPAAEFLAGVRDLLEAPFRLLV
jgi:pyruvate dehydrogenase E2 component (dihydrolipoamide acetyltransferase)